MLTSISLFATAVAAFLGAPVWAIVPGALVLLDEAIRDHHRETRRIETAGAVMLLSLPLWRRAERAVLMCAAAYAVGAVVASLV